MKLLNDHERTQYDSRNEEAKKHNEHTIHHIKDSIQKHPINGQCVISDVICIDCKKQFKVYNWND